MLYDKYSHLLWALEEETLDLKFHLVESSISRELQFVVFNPGKISLSSKISISYITTESLVSLIKLFASLLLKPKDF